jgi:hypothetical protein
MLKFTINIYSKFVLYLKYCCIRMWTAIQFWDHNASITPPLFIEVQARTVGGHVFVW